MHPYDISRPLSFLHAHVSINQVYPLLVFPIAIFQHEHEGFLRNPKRIIPGTTKQVRDCRVCP